MQFDCAVKLMSARLRTPCKEVCSWKKQHAQQVKQLCVYLCFVIAAILSLRIVLLFIVAMAECCNMQCLHMHQSPTW
jgi:hypothetical protein